MRSVLRWAAIAIAVGGVVDPAVARRREAPLTVQFRLPNASDPDFVRARELRDTLVRSIGSGALFDGSSAPHAIVVVGDAEVGEIGAARAFAIPLPLRQPAASITKLEVPHSRRGQSVVVNASVHGLGLAGRSSTIDISIRGAVVDSIQHAWTADDERFDARLSFVAPGAGVHHLQVGVTTAGADSAIADGLALVRDEPLRVLVYEPRPSWPVAFVRRSLESDALFEVSSLVRSSRPAATTSGAAPPSLASLDPERFDALMVGSLGDLRDSDLTAMQRFVTERGGSLVLLPDRQMPPRVRDQFELPAMEEVLLDKPAEVRGIGVALQASELLLARAPDAAVQSLATVRQANRDRTVIAAVPSGAGRIVLSGALDAWRDRAGASSGFEDSWRALLADAALAAPSRITIHAEPAISRPGETVRVTVDLRPTEFDRTADGIHLPPVSASAVADDGRVERLRLWPAAPPGRFEATFVAPRSGRFNISASIAGSSADLPLVVMDSVTQPDAGRSGAPAHAARATGGAIVKDAGELTRALAALDTGTRTESSRPMRSAWWIVPFMLLLCAEWGLRRRSGLK